MTEDLSNPACCYSVIATSAKAATVLMRLVIAIITKSRRALL
jgi:hypothetical protein